jgi:hypothetical protein
MTVMVDFKKGFYTLDGNELDVGGMEFPLVKDHKVSRNGDGYVTVDGSHQPGFPGRNIRIRCNVGDFTVSGNTVAKKVEETDEQIIERLRGRFEVLHEMTAAVKEGNVRAMIVTGPPGVGKSFGVEEVLNRNDIFDQMANRPPKYEVVKGAMSAVGLYTKLYEYSERGNVVVFDDCDSVLLDDLSLNILKAALDTSKKRTISWNTDSAILRREGIPDRFDFNAGAIFITNIKFENVKSKKLRDHLEALESRCHYVDLQMDTDREKILRIKQIVSDGMLDHYNFDPIAKDEVVDFIEDNKNRLRETSLRTVLKVADLRKSFPTRWKDMANVTVMAKH